MFDAKRIENDEPQKPNLVAHKTREKENEKRPGNRRYSNSVGHPKRVVRAAGGPTTLERGGVWTFSFSLPHLPLPLKELLGSLSLGGPTEREQ